MNEQTELLVATGNAGKVCELSLLLAEAPLRLRLLSEFPGITEAEETGQTFAENATIKALQYSSQSGLLTLSDDSGLVVDALGGAPGVYSARYAGAHATYAERMARLLGELAATGDDERRARFVCVIALARPKTGVLATFEGVRRAHRARAARHGRFRLRPRLHPRRPRADFRRAARPRQTKHQPPRTRTIEGRQLPAPTPAGSRLDRRVSRSLECRQTGDNNSSRASES